MKRTVAAFKVHDSETLKKLQAEKALRKLAKDKR